MEDKVKEELEELIKEGKTLKLDNEGNVLTQRLFLLRYRRNYLAQCSYIKWSEIVVRFIRANYPEESENFIKIKEKEMYSLHGLSRMISILEAIKEIPQRIEKKEVIRKKSGDTHIHNNINQSQNQSQEQSQSQKLLQEVFLEAIKDDLTGAQVKELRAILDKHKGDIEKAKPKLKDKLLSFGGNVLSGIITSILTNPALLAVF